MLTILCKISRGIEKGLEFLLIAALTLMTAIVLAGVFFRYVLERPLVFSFEASTILFAWIVFLGSFLAYKDRFHLGVRIIDGYLSVRGRRILAAVRNLVILLVSLYLADKSWDLAMRAGQRVPSLQVSVRIFYIAMPIGFALMAVLSAVRSVTALRGSDDPPDDDETNSGDGEAPACS
ncbi:TRAP transporter small permease [Oricola thermophila]|uniref:TRAP transporter small permease protein n=1 Tax=Oricola thermophila TaxID=2742145 RepID=A0A6N1VDT5_9HYPH|nr:TRAP transporter small permease [Oricola thermophila]QKV19090.1 TRAP transporter small permease [Oricola thermophila]